MSADGEVIWGASSPYPGEDQHRPLVARLVRATFAMHQIDELFTWITDLMVQRFRVQVAQIWARCQNQQGSVLVELRSSSRLDPFFPESLISNPEIAALVGQTLWTGQSFTPELVEQRFSSPFALILHHYRLNYSSSFFLGSSTTFLPAKTGAIEQTPAPLAITLLLFFSQIPSQSEFLDMNDLFQKILPVARSRRFLLAAPPGAVPLPTQQKAAPDLFELIPHRHEDPADNPLAVAALLKDEPVRHFYKAMNERRTVRELCTLTGLESTEATLVVRKLLALSRIKLYQPDGRSVEGSSLFGAR